MPARIADYSIIADGGLDATQMAARTWTMPANVDVNSRCILSFMAIIKDPESVDSVSVTIYVNATKVWSHTFSEPFYGAIQEVIPKGLLVPGSANVINFIVEAGDSSSLGALQNHAWVSDVVVFWQANI